METNKFLTSLYNYYIHLEQLTDTTGTADVNVRDFYGYFQDELTDTLKGPV